MVIFVALLSYLPLKSNWSVPPFFLYTAQVVKQLASAPGVWIGLRRQNHVQEDLRGTGVVSIVWMRHNSR